MFLLWLSQMPRYGDWTPASVPPLVEGRSSPTNTPVFPLVLSSYRVLCGSIYSFPLVSYSCLLSAGVLHALLCLKVCLWCIRGERCTPWLPAPLPSCSPPPFFLLNIFTSNICSKPSWTYTSLYKTQLNWPNWIFFVTSRFLLMAPLSELPNKDSCVNSVSFIFSANISKSFLFPPFLSL